MKYELVQVPLEQLKELLVDVVNDAIDRDRASRKTDAIAPEHISDKAPLPDLITRKQAADILQVSSATVDNYAADGILTKKKIGLRNVRFDLHQVQRLARAV